MYVKHYNYNPFTFEGCSFIAFVILTPYLIWRELTKRFGNENRRRKDMNLLHVKPVTLLSPFVIDLLFSLIVIQSICSPLELNA